MTQRAIFTPDRRLRVFVSSTLRELARERAVAREAISSLRLAPILFELGARPHAPRDLYAAYVEQCDVFVGIYWQSYGWVAPGSEISGIEDELNLADGKPMLLYLKEPAAAREEPLHELIRRIEEQAGAAYRVFSTGEELRTLVTDDLALLLTERFHARPAEPDEQPVSAAGLPARTTSFVGRERELDELVALVDRSDVRLVTLTGPGGIGKTRLALEAARRLAPGLADGAAFVALDMLTDPEHVSVAIADAVGISALGPNPEAVLARRLRGRRLLLLLDNFEHVLDAAPLVTRLLEACGGVEVLATSREPLRLQGEHEYAVPPLSDPSSLFVERAGAVRGGIEWDEENVRAAQEICRRVDGLPLAVELVAAGVRLLAPKALVEQLESSLDAPSTGRRDAPARQQTVRATIDWSYGLLSEQQRDLFERLGAFAGSFTIEAARSVAGDDGAAVLPALSALVDKSLVVDAASGSQTRFRMLQLVADYAAERLAERADADDVRAAHAAYFLALGEAAFPGLRGKEQRVWKDALDHERENVRRALVTLEDAGRVDEAAGLVWSLWVYWLTGHFLDARKVVAELLSSPTGLSPASRTRLKTVDGVLAALFADIGAANATLAEVVESLGDGVDEVRSSALAGLGIATAPTEPERGRALLLESARLFAEQKDAWGEAMALGAVGWLDTGRGDFTDERGFVAACELARYLENEIAIAHAATNMAELYLDRGRDDDAREILAVALHAHEAVRLYDGLSYGLEAAARLAWSGGRVEDATRLLGAADWLREEAGVPIWGARRARFDALVEALRDASAPEAFDAAWAEGRSLGFDGAVRAAQAV